jgi:hypothetical protein
VAQHLPVSATGYRLIRIFPPNHASPDGHASSVINHRVAGCRFSRCRFNPGCFIQKEKRTRQNGYAQLSTTPGFTIYLSPAPTAIELYSPEPLKEHLIGTHCALFHIPFHEQ